MSMIKYRVHEVAKDFNTTSKVITQILTDYATTPKNHMQVLENNELDVIFEYLTQHNQAESLADIFASAPKAGEAKPAEKKQEKTAAKPAEKAHVAQQPAPEKKEKENKPHVPRQVAEKRVVGAWATTNEANWLPDRPANAQALSVRPCVVETVLVPKC